MACGDVLSLEDLQTAKKHQVFEAEVITGKAGGVAGGTPIDYAINQVTGQTQKTLPAVLRDAGFRPAPFTFVTGGTLAVGDSDMAVLWPVSGGGDGQYYIWKGPYPKVVPAASSPASTGGVSASGWLPLGDITLRSELGGTHGASLIGQATYAQIRSYAGAAARVYCLGAATVFDKAYGEFVVDPADTTTLDNGGTVLVDALGRRWKRKFSGAIRFDWWAQDATGTADASVALAKADSAPGSNNLIIDGVYRIAAPLTFTKRLTFLDGSRLKFNTGVGCTMNKRPSAEPDQYIIESDVAAVVATTKWPNAYADWFGAKTSIGIGAGISSALSVTNNVILNSGDYPHGLVPVTLPQNRAMRITGAGFRQTKIAVPSGNVSLSYQRTAATPASSLVIEDLEFVETTAARTSIALIWWGYSAGTPGAETAINDDNWLRVKRCVFTGVGKGTHTKFAGQCHFEENMSLYSGIMHFKERGSSFHYHAREMCLAGQFVNGAYIYGDDPVNDAYSNGLFVDSCNSVTATGIDIRLKNWQAVFIDKSGWDLGSAGPAALWFQLCQDVQIDSCWVASTASAAAANRYGVYFDNCRNSNVSKCTIVNNKRGVSGLSSTSIGVSDTTFEANLEYDIADSGVSVGWAIHGTRHRTTVSSGAPIWLNTAGSGSHVVVGTIMKQGSHTIPLGINSQVAANVFGAGLS
jgi:hypothetical protein